MRFQQNRQHMDGRQQSIQQPATTLWRDRQMDLAPFKIGALLGGACFDHLHVNSGMTAPMTSQKGSEQVCDNLRGCRNLQRSGLSAAQCSSIFGKVVSIAQQLPTASQQVLSVWRQPKATADVFKEDDAQLQFQRMDLSRSCRLTEIQTRAGTAKPAHFGGDDKGT